MAAHGRRRADLSLGLPVPPGPKRRAAWSSPRRGRS